MHGRSHIAAHIIGGVLLAMAATRAAPMRADIPTLFGEIRGNETAANSAVSVTAFSLAYFQKPIGSIGVLARSLGAGASWDRYVEPAKITEALATAGLRVTAVKNASFGGIAAILAKHPRGRMVIISLRGLRIVGGHSRRYVALLGYDPRMLYLVDTGTYAKPVSLRYLTKVLGRNLGGNCLLVRPGGAPQAKRPYPVTGPHEIVLGIGEIATGPGTLKIPFLLQNTLNTPIKLSATKGSCFCFRGAVIETPNHEIKPGKIADVVLSFNRGEIGIGSIEREILISFIGYPHHWLRVVVKCHITAKHPPIQLTWYPQEICLGVVRKRAGLGGQKFTVLTPHGVFLKIPIASSKIIRVIGLNDSRGKPEVDKFGRTAHEFVVDLSRLPAGMVHEKITIGTTDKYVPNIVIPITGRVERMATTAGRSNP